MVGLATGLTGFYHYQTLPITYFSLYLALLFHGHMKRLCPDPIVGLGARLACSENLISLTQLTMIGAIFAFTRCDISCMLQIVTTNRVV